VPHSRVLGPFRTLVELVVELGEGRRPAMRAYQPGRVRFIPIHGTCIAGCVEVVKKCQLSRRGSVTRRAEVKDICARFWGREDSRERIFCDAIGPNK